MMTFILAMLISLSYKNVKHFLEYYIFIIFVYFLKCLPYKLTLFFLKCLFYIFGVVLGIRKKVVCRQLKLCFPEKTQKEIRNLTKNVYMELAVTVAEVFIFDEKYFQNKIELVNFEEVKHALSLGKGVIIVSAHFGNWEIGAKLVAKEHSEVYAVIKNQKNKLFNAYINKKRGEAGIKIIEMKNALKSIVSALNKNKVVAFLVDQYAQKQGTEIDFMGHPTKAYTSVAQLGLKYGTPIIIAFDIRDKAGKHRVMFNKPLVIENLLYNEKNVLDITRQINNRVEEIIKEHPQLWFWVHRKWRMKWLYKM